MRYGEPVGLLSYITTAKLGALLLYQTGECRRVHPYHTGRIDYARDWTQDWGLEPIDGAKEHGFIH